MTRRSFDDAFWGDQFVQDLNRDAKLFFLYLWTNKRCNSAGLYEITPKTISFETDIPIDDIPRLFEIIKSKVAWDSKNNIVWVKNFLKHQPKSPMYLKSVADSIQPLNGNQLVNEFLSYYTQYGVSIPYLHRIDTVTRQYRDIHEPEPEQDIEQELELLSIGRDLKKYPPEFVVLRASVFKGLQERRKYKSRQPGAEAKAISEMLKEKFTPEQILKAYDILKARPFFLDKNLSMMQVRKDIHEVLKNGTHQNNLKKPEYVSPDELKRRSREEFEQFQNTGNASS